MTQECHLPAHLSVAHCHRHTYLLTVQLLIVQRRQPLASFASLPHPCAHIVVNMRLFLQAEANVPLDLEPRHPRLCVDIPRQQVEADIRWWILSQLLALVLGVLVVAYTDKLLIVVRPREDECRDAKYVFFWYTAWIGCRRCELEGVDPYGHGSDET